MAVTQGQLNYWKSKTQRPNLTMGQAAYQRAQAQLNPTAHAGPAPPTPAKKTWKLPNQSGLTGQQQLYSAYMAKNPGATLPTPAGGVPPAPPVDPTTEPDYTLDSGYFNQVAKQRYEAGLKRTQLDEEGANALTNLTEQTRRLDEQTPRQLQDATNAANKAGGLYTGTHGRNLGDIQTQALRQKLDMRSTYDSGERSRAAARKALEDGATLDEAAAAAEAVDRQVTRDSAAAGDRSLVQESQIPTDALDAGVDVGTPSPKKGKRANTQSTPKYLPGGYKNWSLQRRRSYWQGKRKARRKAHV